MTEKALLHFLQNEISITDFAADMKGSQQQMSYDSIAVYIEPLGEKTDFLIERTHLLRLCGEALNGNLAPEDLLVIAIALATTEYLNIDQDDAILQSVLEYWDTSEVGYPITPGNLEKWKILLETGVNTLTKKDLRREGKKRH